MTDPIEGGLEPRNMVEGVGDEELRRKYRRKSVGLPATMGTFLLIHLASFDRFEPQ